MTAREPGRPARVLYLINGFQRGGAELGLVRLVEGGAFAGCELRVAAIFSGSDELVARLRRSGVEVTSVSHGERMTPVGLLKAAVAIPRLLRRWRPDGLILSLPQANLLGRVASLAARPAMVASFEHNTHLAKPIYERGWRATSGLVDWLIADAPRTAVEAAARLYRRPPARMLVLPLVSLAPRPPPPPARGPQAGPLRLVNAARFTPVKNQAALVRAVALLKAQDVAVELTLYGEGGGLEPCRALAAELGVGDRVAFPGFREDWWNDGGQDLFVLASRHEGLCIVALEAMNAGLPVLAPAVGGLIDYGGDGATQVLADVEPEAIADAVAELAADPGRRDALARAGQAAAQARYGEAETSRAYAAFAAELRSLAR